VAGRRAGTGLALAAVALSAAGCSIGGGGAKTVTSTLTRTVTVTRTVTHSASDAGSPCTSSQLSGTFTVIRGSGAAGQISYDLKLTNTASTSCTFGGATNAQLLSAGGSSLPTHIEPSTGLGLVGAQLSPGVSTSVPARFSPSVPGPGDSQSGPCQPKAHTLFVTLTGGGTVDAPIRPPTSVCEGGTLNFDASQTP
jgi:hypothetical protein